MARNIVLCLDGTWDSLDRDSEGFTNVAFIRDVARFDPDHPNMKDQLVEYVRGVGAGAWMIDRFLMGGFGKGVFLQARDAWRFLQDNHRTGDKIYIFGFSRGAYAARQLASMLTRMGIPRGKYQQIEQGFREWLAVAGTPFSGPPKVGVEFLGLFDCVPANQVFVHLQGTHRLNSPDLEPGIRHFRHALAAAERRWSFKPLVFRDNGYHQSFQQVVFPGFHRDVGGGGKSNDALASYPLWWMMREAYGAGLDFNTISCRLHRAGNSQFMRHIDPDAPPVPSDYLTTRLGIRHVRSKSADFAALSPAPELIDLADCPRGCNRPMFNVHLTPLYQRMLQGMTKDDHQPGGTDGVAFGEGR